MSIADKRKIVASVPQKGFFGHPKGLFTLFFTEFWERFSYYGMRAILVYYMYYTVTRGGLGLAEPTALAIMSVYGSLVYMSSIIGGWFADRVLGASSAVFYGGILIMFGHLVLAVPGSVPMFFVSMVLIVLGTGLLKPNVSSIVGEMYSDEDHRRDSGFSIFYMGINLGGFLAPLIVGTVGLKMNFHYGFALAAAGMFLGLVIFTLTKKRNLGLAGTIVPNPLPAEEKKQAFVRIGAGAAVLAVAIGAAIRAKILTFDSFIALVGILGILLPVLYFIMMYRSPKTTAVERSRIIAYIPLFIASVMFWAIAEQGSTILALYADKRTQLNYAGLQISPAWFQSLNPLFIILLAPVFAWLWVRLKNRQPSVPVKFSLGLLFAGLSFLVILLPDYLGGHDNPVNPLWLVFSYLLVVLGELCLSPVGLSATTKLAPAAFAAQTMSLWFLSNAAAQAINAQLARFYRPETETVYFGVIGAASLLLGVLLFLLAPAIQRYMKGVR